MRIATRLEVRHYNISLMRLWGKLKSQRVSLIKGHSILSKAFSRSNLRIILTFFPFIFFIVAYDLLDYDHIIRGLPIF